MSTKFNRAKLLPLILGLTLVLLWIPGSKSLSTMASPSAGHVEAANAPAAELHVCPSGCAYSSVQAAVDAASEGDIIKVAAGTYNDVHVRPRNDTITTGDVNQVVYISKTVTIQGGYTITNWTNPDPEANLTTLDAEGQGRVIYITGDISPTIEGLRITGGNTTEAGGGIFAYGAKLTVSQTLITSNTAVDKGGGIAIRQVAAASVTDSQIYSNISVQQEGGGVGVYDDSHMNLVRSWVVGNATPTNDGGGIFAGDNGSIYIENSIIAGNTAYVSGGGLHLGDDGPHRIVNSHIVGNYADGVGGAIGTYKEVDVEMTNTLVISNMGTMTGFDDKYGNSAAFLLNYCDTYLNSPDGTIGVIITRTNCLGSPPEEGLDPRMAGGALPSGVGPAFASQWLSYDYSLLGDSPAINAGTSIGTPATDIDGVPRIVPDLGAYEWEEYRLLIDPDILNVKSKAKWVTAYIIELRDGYDVANIDVSTVMLEGTIPAEDHPTEIGDYDNDGITDLMVKFDRQALIEYLDGTTGEVTLTVSGELSDGTPFEGYNSITVTNP